MENKRKRNITIASIAIIILLVVAIGSSFAYFLSQRETEEFTVQSGNLSIDFSTTSTISLTNTIPLAEDEYLTEGSVNTFTVKNSASSTVDAYARMDITDITISDNLKDYDFKWALYEGDTKLTTGSFVTLKDGGNSINIANNLSFPRNGSAKTYKLYVWLNETEADQSNLFNGTFSGKVTVTGQSKKINTLASNILEEVPKTNPSFTQTHTDKGLFVQQDDSTKSNYGFPTYYYRGDVTNNYVSFEGQTWRIVRINEDGSIRLIYESGAQTEPVKTSYFSDVYYCSGYVGSNLETSIKNWYNSNISNKSIIIIGDYCNMNWVDHNYSFEPIFTCNGGTIINEKYATLTADEAVFAGGLFGNVLLNTSSYLETSDADWWLITTNFAGLPGQQACQAWLYIADPGIPDYGYDATQTATFRPVINLKPDVTISGGTGTSSNPYVIK